jgi:uncharacterized DUF497 family protein
MLRYEFVWDDAKALANERKHGCELSPPAEQLRMNDASMKVASILSGSLK